MLHRLIEYADTHEISGEEGFISKRIRFLFQFSPKGDYLGIHDYGRAGEAFPMVPHIQFAGDVPTRQFLVDTIEFLALYPSVFDMLQKEIDIILGSFKKKEELDEINSFSMRALNLLGERKYNEFREIATKEKWQEILNTDEKSAAKKLDNFLKNGGVFDQVFNSDEIKLDAELLNLRNLTNNLLVVLKQEPDFEEIRLISEQVLTLLGGKKYLEVREEDLKRKWANILRRRGRGTRPEIIAFLEARGPVNAVFNNGEFKRIGKNQFCMRLLKEAADADPLFGTISKAMTDTTVLKRIHRDLAAITPAANASNNASFATLDNGELRIFVKESSWRKWWKTKHFELSGTPSTGRARCFLSGNKTTPLLTHPKINGLGSVGGNAQTSLVSFDKGSSSFQSYGFIQGENAAISSDSAVKYVAAANYLLDHHQQQLAGAKIIYWYSKELEKNEDIINAAFKGLGEFEDDDEIEENIGQREAMAQINAKQFLKSVAEGEVRELRNVQYYALTLQGNQGRAVVQNWMEGSFVELARNIQQWFFDLEIPRLSGKGLAKLPKIETMITCLLKERKPKQNYSDWVKPVSNFRDAIWRVVINGRAVPFPENAVRLALLRLRESMLTDEWANTLDSDGVQMGIRRARLYARIGLIKAFLIRNMKQEIDMEDREKNKNSVYWLGCLFAVLADLQRAAHQTDGGDNVKSTIVDRYYTTASSCPKLVHGRLVAQSQHHLRKLENKNQNAAFGINREIAAISQKIDFAEVPDMLPLPEQSWFALGYYQQIAEMNRRKAEAAASKKANSKKGDDK